MRIPNWPSPNVRSDERVGDGESDSQARHREATPNVVYRPDPDHQRRLWLSSGHRDMISRRLPRLTVSPAMKRDGQALLKIWHELPDESFE